jgi:hypothetical protein
VKARRHLVGNGAHAAALPIGDRRVLDLLIEVGNVALLVAPGGIAQRAAQNQGQLRAAMAVLGNRGARRRLDQLQGAVARQRQGMVP